MKLVLASRSFQIADGDGPAFTPFISIPPHLEIRSIFQNYYFSIPFARLSPPKKKIRSSTNRRSQAMNCNVWQTTTLFC